MRRQTEVNTSICLISLHCLQLSSGGGASAPDNRPSSSRSYFMKTENLQVTSGVTTFHLFNSFEALIRILIPFFIFLNDYFSISIFFLWTIESLWLHTSWGWKLKIIHVNYICHELNLPVQSSMERMKKGCRKKMNCMICWRDKLRVDVWGNLSFFIKMDTKEGWRERMNCLVWEECSCYLDEVRQMCGTKHFSPSIKISCPHLFSFFKQGEVASAS